GRGPARLARSVGHDVSGQPAPLHAKAVRSAMGEDGEVDRNAPADALVRTSCDDRCGPARALPLRSPPGSRRSGSAGVRATGQGAQAAVRPVSGSAAEISRAYGP